MTNWLKNWISIICQPLRLLCCDPGPGPQSKPGQCDDGHDDDDDDEAYGDDDGNESFCK